MIEAILVLFELVCMALLLYWATRPKGQGPRTLGLFAYKEKKSDSSVSTLRPKDKRA